MHKFFKKGILSKFLAITLVVALLSALTFSSVSAEPAVAETAGKVLDIDLTTPNSVNGVVEFENLTDFFLGHAVFDLGVPGGAEGTIGFDETEGAAFVKAAAPEANACGTRIIFYSKHGPTINGTDYRYMKIRFKSAIPLTADTTVALRDMATDWAYYGVAYNANGSSDWTEVVIDLKAGHTLSPARSWESAAIGVGETFCLEFLDNGWSNGYIDNTIYLSGISFYEKAEDVLPTTVTLDFNSANSIAGAENLSDFYIEKATFDLHTGGVAGNIAYDEEVGAVYVQNAAPATAPAESPAECGTRVFIRAKQGVQTILGSAYPYMKIRFKSDVPLTEKTYISIRDFGGGNWGYYGEVWGINGTTDWVEAVFDLRTGMSLSPQANWATADVCGRADTFAIEICDADWANAYPDGLKIYFDSITFSANSNFGEDEEGGDVEEVKDNLILNFDSPEAVSGATNPYDFYLSKSVFDIGTSGVLGTVGYSEEEGAVFAKAIEPEALSCGARLYINAIPGVAGISGSDYRYMKITFKSEIPLSAGTTVAIRDTATHWGYYGAAHNVGGSEGWTEVIIDFKSGHLLSPAANWNDATIGVGDTFCIEFLDQNWQNSYVENTFYLKQISFHKEVTGLLPERQEFTFNSANAIAGAENLSDLYIERGDFDLHTNGIAGNLGFDEVVGAVYAENGAPATVNECGARVFFRFKNGVQPILGSAYPIVKIRFKTNVPLTENTYIAIRDFKTSWVYYGEVVRNIGGTTDWIEAVFDMRKASIIPPVGNWGDYEIGGRPDSFAVEICDTTWENVYPDGLKVYFDSITFADYVENDSNVDGVVNILDLINVKNALLGISIENSIMDFNVDAKIDIVDLLLMKDLLLVK